MKILNALAFLFSSLIVGLRPILGPARCKFVPSCTRYAIQSLGNESLHRALWLITKRLLSCNPFV